jgi:predicted nucleic acid-binding protein
MQVVLDSNEFLFAFLAKKKECILVLRACRSMNAVIPSIVLEEVSENIKIESGKINQGKSGNSFQDRDGLK